LGPAKLARPPDILRSLSLWNENNPPPKPFTLLTAHKNLKNFMGKAINWSIAHTTLLPLFIAV